VTYRLRIRSRLATDRRTLWAHASSMDGVNAELAPVRMSHPAGAAIVPGVSLGRPLFRSVVSLWGLVPLDVHELGLVDVRPDEGFHESSRSVLERRWIHRRSLADAPDGVAITDELEFEPRILGFLVARIVAATFERRHACLRRLFGGCDAGPSRVEWLPSA
jgi:hypothetical protein